VHISVSIFCNNIQQTLGMCCNLHKALSWAKQEEFFFLHFFVGIFWVKSLKIIFETFGAKLKKKISGILAKKYQN